MSHPALEITGLRTAFGISERWHAAVRALSLTLTADETLALVGESGCGNSVTALSVMGLVMHPRSRSSQAWAFRCSPRGSRPARCCARPLPARVQRRTAPAHRHRPRAHGRARADRGGRAGLGARRLGPGAGAAAACRTSRAARPPLRQPRPLGRAPGSATAWPRCILAASSRKGRRRVYWRSRCILMRRCCATPLQSAARRPLPPTLPAGDGSLRARDASLGAGGG